MVSFPYFLCNFVCLQGIYCEIFDIFGILRSLLVGIGHAQILANNSRILFLQVSQRSKYKIFTKSYAVLHKKYRYNDVLYFARLFKACLEIVKIGLALALHTKLIQAKYTSKIEKFIK